MNDNPPNDSNNVEPTPSSSTSTETNVVVETSISASPVVTPTMSPSPNTETPPITSREKVIATILSLLVTTCLSGGLFAYYYNSLIKYEDVKFVRDEVSCIEKSSNDCRVSKQRFTIYRFGEKPITDASLVLKLDPPFTIVKGSPKLEKYEKALFSSQKKGEVDVKSEVTPDPRFTKENSYRTKINELSPAQIYELTLDVESQNNQKFDSIGKIEITHVVEGEQKKFRDFDLNYRDYFRLYALEFTVFGIILAIPVFCLLWLLTVGIFKKTKKGVLP